MLTRTRWRVLATAVLTCSLLARWCLSADEAAPLATWQKICSFVPPKAVQKIVYERGKEYAIHRIKDAAGERMNLDYFPIRVRKMPVIDGKRLTPDQFLEYLRLHLNDVVNTELCSFKPYRDEDTKTWTSKDPTGAILLLDIVVYKSPAKDKVIDKACVVCAMRSPQVWRFSTIRAGTGWTALNNPDNPGAHPVSGNREFGFFKGPAQGEFTFYTIGADRATRGLDEFFGFPGADDIGYKMGDQLWESFQKGIVDLLKKNQGDGEVIKPTVMRKPWNEIEGNRTVYDPRDPWYTRSELGL